MWLDIDKKCQLTHPNIRGTKHLHAEDRACSQERRWRKVIGLQPSICQGGNPNIRTGGTADIRSTAAG